MRFREMKAAPSQLRLACLACGLGVAVAIGGGQPVRAQPADPPPTGGSGAAVPAPPSAPQRSLDASAAGRIHLPARAPIGLRLPASGALQRWTVEPSVSAMATATDNAGFDPPADAESDVFLELFPSITISGRSPRVELDLDYTGQVSYAARGTASTEYLNSLAAVTRITAIENFLFIDASAEVSQNYISALAPRPLNPEGEPANRVEERSIAVSPFIEGLIRGPDIAYTLRYNWAATTFEEEQDPTLPTPRTTEWIGQIAGPLGRKLAWSIDYLNSVTEWENQPVDQKYQQYLGTLYYQVDPLLTLSASAGREYNNFSLVDQWYTNYGGGIRWRPFQRTLAAANVMKRFFGTGYELVFNHRHRRAAFALNASRDIATYSETAFSAPGGGTRSLLDAALTAQIADPAERRTAVNQLIALSGLPPIQANTSSFFTQAVMLQNQIEGAFAIIGVRNIATIAAFRRDRRPIGTLVVGVPDDAFINFSKETETGGAVSFTHRISPLTALSAVYGRSYVRGFVADVPTNTATEDTVLVTLSRRFGPRTTAFVGARYQRFADDPSEDPPTAERAIMAGITYFF